MRTVSDINAELRFIECALSLYRERANDAVIRNDRQAWALYNGAFLRARARRASVRAELDRAVEAVERRHFVPACDYPGMAI